MRALFRNLYQGKSYKEIIMTVDDVNFVKFNTVVFRNFVYVGRPLI
jgi:hypothetical protein